jgi:hypothetical protein
MKKYEEYLIETSLALDPQDKVINPIHIACISVDRLSRKVERYHNSTFLNLVKGFKTIGEKITDFIRNLESKK